MKIAVCVKQIPDPDGTYRLDPETNRLDRSENIILDEADSYSVEVAMQIVEAVGTGEVVLVSVTPDGETTGIRAALAMGANKAVVVSDPALEGSDALSTAKVLAAAIRRIEPQLILAAPDSTDGRTGTLPVQLAELLDLPAVTFAKQVDVDGDVVRVKRQAGAVEEDVSCSLPAVVTVTAELVRPRYASFRAVLAAKGKPIEQVTLADLGVDPSSVGSAGSRQRIISVRDAPQRAAGAIVTDDGSSHERIIGFLDGLGVL